MSTHTSTIAPSEGRLADEISDMIDEHGRGLEADQISRAIEQVAGHLEEEFDEEVSARQLERELYRFVDGQSETTDRASLVETLRAIAESLRQGSLTPEVGYERRYSREQITLVFDSAFALRQKIPNLLDIRGYFIECDQFPVNRDDISIVIQARHPDASVELSGRVLRSAPNGLALQIDDISPSTRRQLCELADQMRRARQERTSD